MALYTPEWYSKDRILTINSIIKNYQRVWGENVLYFEYDQMGSSKHTVYDEGPSRVWYPPFTLPVIFLDFRQDDPIDTDEGFYVLSTASIVFQVTEGLDRFRINPLYTEAHFRDRFQYDNRIYRVTKYEKQGFVHGTYLTISALGEQVKGEEMVNDAQQSDFFSQTLVW